MNFDDEFFTSVGLGGAGAEEKLKLATELAETAQNRVAVRLSEVLTEEEMGKFADLVDQDAANNTEEAFVYLGEVYPEYELIIQDEIETVKAELAQNVAAVRAAIESDGPAEEPAAEEPTT